MRSILKNPKKAKKAIIYIAKVFLEVEDALG